MSNKDESRLLEEAVALALEAHRGQKDRAGQPYILHPLRVMCRVQTPAEKITALLHDVIEDSNTTLEDLRARGFPEEIVKAVGDLFTPWKVKNTLKKKSTGAKAVFTLADGKYTVKAAA